MKLGGMILADEVGRGKTKEIDETLNEVHPKS